MPQLDDKTFLSALKRGEHFPVYLFYGKETFLMEHCLNSLLNVLLPQGKDSPLLKRFDGEALDIDRFCTEVEELPMFLDKKCVLLQNPNLEKMGKEEFEAVCRLTGDPNPSTVLILYCSKYPFNSKSARGKKLAGVLLKQGALVACEKKSGRELIRLIVARASRGGSAIGEREAAYLVERCGEELLTLMSETDKLSAFRQGDSISKEDIDLATRKSLEASVFDLSRLIRQRQPAKAFLLVGELMDMREEPIAVLGALNMAFLDLYRAKLGAAAGKSEGEITRDFSYKSSFRVKNALRDCRQYSLSQLEQALDILSDTDVKIKSSRADGRLLLEEAVFSLLRME